MTDANIETSEGAERPVPGLLEAHSLSRVYRTLSDEVRVFENVELSIKPGTAVAIIGQSGRGKTTLLNILSGLDRPTSGEVLYNGSRIDDLDEVSLSDFRNRNVGFIFQHHYLLEDFTALENVLVPIRIAGRKINSAAVSRAAELLDNVGLAGRHTHYPDQLSGGERQRVAIIRALIHDPRVIFADEPTGSLDRRNSAMIEELLWDLKHKYNKTFVIATHNLEMARKCDHVIDLG
jgi:ABC-type lipoprotein export system ATPase subunit